MFGTLPYDSPLPNQVKLNYPPIQQGATSADEGEPIAIMPLSRILNSTFAMPNIIDSHDMGLRTVLQSRRPKVNAYSTPMTKANAY
ncbi:hypothetical protein TNCV_1548802 [Trichonephila clavipes]|nr:hypothetical protein TNCV_1548802 [Trichonephila clavipes]